jgi:epoxyqueuosine reductase QueG
MLLSDLQDTAEAFLAGSGRNHVEHPDPISTPAIAAGPLRIYDPPLFAVADAGDPLWAKLKEPEVIGPRHRTPEEWLAGARSVVSYFLPFSERVRKANRVPGVTATEWIYARWEGEACNAALATLLAGTLEASGARALAPMADPRFQVVDLRSNWSERHAAFIAGLGTFSLTRSMITRLGAAGRFGSVVTDAVLPPTLRPYQSIYEHCRDCGICIDRCPCRAIDATGKDHQVCKVYLDQTRVLYAPRYGCGKCQTAVPCERRIPGDPHPNHFVL